MQALKVGEHITLIFTKVMDELSRGLVDEDEDAEQRLLIAPTGKKAEATVQLVDDLLGIAREINPSLDLKYNKFYIGLSKDGQPFNFAQFRPRKNTITRRLTSREPTKSIRRSMNWGLRHWNMPQDGSVIVFLCTKRISKNTKLC